MFEGNKWDTFLAEIAKIESQGSGGYTAKGGSGDHYDGKYQLGKAAKTEAGRILGITIGHDTASRESFRNNPALQEQAMKGLVTANHRALGHYQGEAYTGLTESQQLAILGYAHNQGALGASNWMTTGVVKEDGNGTKADKYSIAVQSALSALPEPVEEEVTDVNALDTEAQEQQSMYVVQPNDSMYQIAKNSGMSLEDLQTLNPEVTDPTALQIGHELKVGNGWFEKT